MTPKHPMPCDWCDGTGIHGREKVCPRCEGTGIDPRYRDEAAPTSVEGTVGLEKRIREIRARLDKIPPHFCTRGARHGGTMQGCIRLAPEEACNTIMDHEGRVIADSLNADYRLTCIEEIDGSGAWREVGTLAYFDVFANAPEDLRFLLDALARAV
jgi:hypothetical protein